MSTLFTKQKKAYLRTSLNRSTQNQNKRFLQASSLLIGVMSFRNLIQRFKTNSSESSSFQQDRDLTAETTFWRPSFDPSRPVSLEWEYKLGHSEGGWGNAELQSYTSSPDNSFHTSDGKLVLRAIQARDGATPTSSRLVSRTRLTHPRGHLAATLTLPCATGIWPAFWLLPSEPFTWPGEGEVDIAETWNGSEENHSCLHWGFYTAEDADKHRSVKTSVKGMKGRPLRFDFYWDASAKRLVWVMEDRPVMRASLPDGLRPMEEWNILLNVAMGGNVCGGQVPQEGEYDLVVHEISMSKIEPKAIDRLWSKAIEGKTL